MERLSELYSFMSLAVWHLAVHRYLMSFLIVGEGEKVCGGLLVLAVSC